MMGRQEGGQGQFFYTFDLDKVVPSDHLARPIDAIETFFPATLGGARALELDDRIGTLAPGREADIVVLDPNATPLLAFRNRRSGSIAETLAVLATLGDDRAVRATYVAGKLAHARLSPAAAYPENSRAAGSL
jgi:guanine deaminase